MPVSVPDLINVAFFHDFLGRGFPRCVDWSCEMPSHCILSPHDLANTRHWAYVVSMMRQGLVQLSNGIFLLKRVSRYGRCFMIDSGSKGCPEQESAGCHFGTLGRNFLRAKTKWPPNISRSNMIFQLMEPGTSVIPHFYVILTGQSISCIILMTEGHLQGQKDNFKVKEAKIQFLTNKDRNMCNTSFTWGFIWKWMYGIILLIQG